MPYRVGTDPALPRVLDPDLNGDGEPDHVILEPSFNRPDESHVAVYPVLGGVTSTTAIFVGDDVFTYEFVAWSSFGDLDCDGIDDLVWTTGSEATWGFPTRSEIVGGAASGLLATIGGTRFGVAGFARARAVNLDDSCSAEMFGFAEDYLGDEFFGWFAHAKPLSGPLIDELEIDENDPFPSFPVEVWEDANCDGYHDIAFVGLSFVGIEHMYFGGPSGIGAFGYHPLFARAPDFVGPWVFASGNELFGTTTSLATFPNPIIQVVHADVPWDGDVFAVTETCATCAGTVLVLTSEIDQGPLTERLTLTSSVGTPQYYGSFSIAGRIAGEELLAFVRPSGANNVYGTIEVRRLDPSRANVFLPGVYEIAPVGSGDGYGQPRFVEYNGVPGIAAYSRDSGRYQLHEWLDAVSGFSPAVLHTY